MVIRRIRDHVAQQNWFAVGIDLAIVVVGVFLGQQVSNWNDDRKERAQSREDRQRLIADLRANEIDLSNRSEYFRSVLSHAESALAALVAPSPKLGQGFLVDAYQATQIVPREAKHVAYDEILATGRLTRLGDPVLRDRVGNYYILQRTTGVTFANVPAYREKLRRAMPGAIQATIRSHCPETRTELPDDTILNTLPAQCDPALDAAIVAFGVHSVREIPELEAELNRQIGDLTVKIELATVMRGRAEKLRRQIAATDGPA